MKKVISFVYRLLFSLFSMLPVTKKTIIFESFNGKLPSDNPYYIFKELERRESDYKLYWGIKKELYSKATQTFPDIVFVKRFSISWLLKVTRAKFWVFNARMPIWLRKNKQTIYIQTWHGTPLKKLGLDIENVRMPGTKTDLYHENFVKEADRWDYLIAPNLYSEKIFQNAFNYKNTFLEIGYPRNDKLVRHKNDVSLKKQLKLRILGKETGKVYLYAPTWRDDYFVSIGKYKFHMPFDLEKITASIGKEDVLIIRPHYLVADSIDILGYEKNVFISLDEDINDLFLISDTLITDYSSVFFDYSILRRPMIFYPYDLAYYENSLRGFYLDYNQVPGDIVYKEEELYNRLSMQYEKSSIEKIDSFFNTYNDWETENDSSKVVNLILEVEGK
ncbi:CDP-glycerol glycerophosphotransferase family protein [Enterococcus gallinarum]|uniref:CDP-glycerol glycerophosphotransferase family protein n=1 Tax=Enterococcus gallinarum TaxID=1353 RepID=UPI00115B1783|nr:CDP-glycerol glycerophosphotransferase family protein [Enterococcus gallinarum]MEB5881595.1 CDP-glycerol glycerophosphotransferase family protein [Enterococcus gallinarum]